MIILQNRKYQTAVHIEKHQNSFSYDETLPAEDFNLLMTNLLLDYKGFRVRNAVKKAIRKGKLIWDGPNGPVTIKRKK